MFHDQIFSADTPRLDRALADTFFRIGDHELGRKAEFSAQTVAGRTRAVAVGKGKMLGREFRKDVAAHFAGERLAQGEFPPRSLGGFLREHHDAVLAFAKGELEGIREPRALVSDRHEPIDDELQRDLFHPCAGREELGFVEIFNFAGEPDALKTPLAQPRQFLAQHARLRTQKRGE